MPKFPVLVALAATFFLACSGGAVGGSSRDGGEAVDAGSTKDAAATNEGTWFVSETLRGSNLQLESSSVLAERVEDGGVFGTRVTLGGLRNYCALLLADTSCSVGGLAQQALFITVPKSTQPGTYTIESGTAVVALSFFGDKCEQVSPTLFATSGWVKLERVNLTQGGSVELSFDVTTDEGTIVGTMNAPFCR
ncbi:MAG: hypothetical protein U0174_14100 [Polyangiaceae bacterium]